jgi:hypothetical protein
MDRFPCHFSLYFFVFGSGWQQVITSMISQLAS